MMIALYLIDSDVFKVNALIGPICHPELSTVSAQFPNKWICFAVLPHQRCGIISEETQDARPAVHTSSSSRPEQLWI